MLGGWILFVWLTHPPAPPTITPCPVIVEHLPTATFIRLTLAPRTSIALSLPMQTKIRERLPAQTTITITAEC